MSTELILFKFPTITGADEMVEVLKDFQTQGFVEVDAAVVAKKYDEQHVEVRQTLGAGPRKGAAAGAVAGALLGLPGGPAGAAVGLATGALIGGAIDATKAPGAQSEELKSVARYELQDGESALLVYADSLWSGQIEQVAQDVNAAVYRRSSVQYAEAEVSEHIHIYKATLEPGRQEQLDRVYASWEEDLARERAALATLRQRADTAAQAEKAKLQQRIAEANAKRDQYYENMLNTLEVRRQQIKAEIARLETEAKQEQAQAKNKIEQRLTAAREADAKRYAEVRAVLGAELDDLKTDVASFKADITKARGAARTEWDARVAQLEAEWTAEKKRLEQLDKGEVAAWDAMSQSVKQAVGTYRDTIRKAEDDFRKEQLDRMYASWEEDLAQARGELAALKAQVSTAAQAEKVRLQQQIAEAKAKIDQFYQNVLRALNMQRQQIKAEIARLEGEAKQAQAKAKADIDQHLADARAADAKHYAEFKAVLMAELDDLKADIASLKADVAHTSSDLRAKWDARIAQLEADWATEKQRIEQLDKTEFAAWDAMSQNVKQAVGTYRDAVRKAETDFHKEA